MKPTHEFRIAGVLAVIASCTVPSTDSSVPGDPTGGRALDGIEAIAYADDGLPFMMHGRLGRAASSIVEVEDVTPALASALPPLAARFGVRTDDLVPTRVQRDALGMTHVRYAQRKNGLPVIGGDFVVHLEADRVIASVNGSIRDDATLPADPRVSVDTAREIARGATSDGDVDVTSSELVYVIATRDGAMYLAWQVEVTGRRELLHDFVYVDAIGGEVVERRPQVFTARNREIRDGNNCTYPFGCSTTQIVGTEASPPSGDAVALAAFTNTGITYDCYSTLFGRDSYDDAGGKLTSVVHVRFFAGNGATGNNAAWAGDRMVYGDGDGTLMSPLAHSLDVTAHELTHGVTSSTANLTYQNEPGALNEGMSDILAAVCEAWHDGAISEDTWLIGEDIFTPNTAGDALRYMNNPTADASLYPPQLGGSRDYYPERYTGTQDQGGVHLNSGIPNLAFHLLVAGGKHPRNKTTFIVPSIGIEKAGEIFQRALTQGYFTSNTNMAQARTQTEMIAEQLYPGSTATAVALAWAAVGVGMPPTPTDTTPPTVSITVPADGATVDPGFAIHVEASDDVGVERVEIEIDGQPAGAATSAPYDFTAPDTIEPGSHTVTAIAYDVFNQATATITVTVASGAQCESDDDCPGVEECENNTCVAPTSCTMDTDCDAGEQCMAGLCVPGGNPETGEGGGCCSAGNQRGAIAGNLMLLLGTLLVVGRRRRR